MIYHIAVASEWSPDGGDWYVPTGFEDEGFVHCSTASQIVASASRHFSGRSDLVLLTIDEALLRARVVWEDSHLTGIEFPHIYGPVNRDAVVGVSALVSGPDGGFGSTRVV